jgi:hypothetical protein
MPEDLRVYYCDHEFFRDVLAGRRIKYIGDVGCADSIHNGTSVRTGKKYDDRNLGRDEFLCKVQGKDRRGRG